MRRSALFTLAFVVIVIAAAPAVLMDAALKRVSEGRTRLASPDGSLWRGRGYLAQAGAGRQLSPWLSLGWEFDPSRLLHGEAAWTLEADGQRAARITLGFDGWRIDDPALTLPAQALFQALPHPAFHFGWRGWLEATGKGLECDWRNRCSGKMVFAWRAASTDILLEPRLGDYRAEADADGGALHLLLSTTPGSPLQIHGNIDLSAGEPPVLDLMLDGAPAIIDRLAPLINNIAQRDGPRLRIRSP
jgi:general secretion pathway protein N